MPSFTSIAAIALGLLTMSAPALAFAGESDMQLEARAESDIFARANLERRRPNHADAYGYPHGLGPARDPRHKLTPGGYVDPRPENLGAPCRNDAGCSLMGKIRLGAAQCQNGRCGFRCLGDSVKSNGQCIGAFSAPSCRRDSSCPKLNADLARVAHPVCNDGKCTFECNERYHHSGNTCKHDADPQCGNVTCPPLAHGSNQCRAGACTPVCNTHAGYELYEDDQGNFMCVNTQSDPENCGGVGPNYVCPEGYNGLGTPTCTRGTCGLDCRGYTAGRINGQPYCMAK